MYIPYKKRVWLTLPHTASTDLKRPSPALCYLITTLVGLGSRVAGMKSIKRLYFVQPRSHDRQNIIIIIGYYHCQWPTEYN